MPSPAITAGHLKRLSAAQVLACTMEAAVLRSDSSALAKDCRAEIKGANARLQKLGRKVLCWRGQPAAHAMLALQLSVAVADTGAPHAHCTGRCASTFASMPGGVLMQRAPADPDVCRITQNAGPSEAS